MEEKNRKGRLKSGEYKLIPVGSWVMKMRDEGGGSGEEGWEGPMRVISYRKETKGYVLLNMLGEKRTVEVPGSRLSVIAAKGKPRREAWAEHGQVKKIVAHRGEENKREYKV